MIKRILVPLDPSPFTDMALEIACWMAKQSDAEVTGLVILDIPGIKDSIGPVPAGAFHYAEHLEEAKEREAKERIRMLIAKFKSKCEKEHVHHREASSQGVPSEEILKYSFFFDAVVIGLRTFFHFETEDKPGDSLEKLLEECVTPIYGVPQNMRIPEITRGNIKVLIPYNGTLPATRAMHRFAQLSQPELMDVKLVFSDDDKDKADFCLTQAELFLRAHGIKKLEKLVIEKDIIRAVKEDFIDWSDMIVIGAHSKKGIFDFMVGSLTRYLIKEAKEMVLIGQ